MKARLIISGVVLMLVSILVGYHFVRLDQNDNIRYVKIAGQNIKVDLAITPAEQSKGLSGRTAFGENEGMLFVFPELDKHRFWMKNMNFPIDIIWIGEDLRVVYIKKNATPESYPESYGPDLSTGGAKYVLEVVSGFAEKNDLKKGDSVKFAY